MSERDTRLQGPLRAVVGLALCFSAACATTARKSPAFDWSRKHEEPELAPPMAHHRVEQGQTVFRIAKTYGITTDELMAANGMTDPTLSVGQDLIIPAAVNPEVKGTDAVHTAYAGRPSRQESRPSNASRSVASRANDPLAGTLQWPLRGVLYARFGRKGHEPHDGIDLAAPAGTPVRAAAGGRVLFAGEQRAYGRMVILQHDQGLVTLYAHNRDLNVRTDQTVRAGQIIATVGESGRTSGPHLHFEVRKGTIPVDPLEYLGAVPSS